MPTHRESGQAAPEYLGVVLLVAAALAAAAALAVGVPGLGERVVATIRTGLCIVAGDVCRDADAAAAGLDPCVTSARATRQETALDIAVLRIGESGEWELAVQSDGAAVVTRLEESDLGPTAGVGLTFSPLGAELGVSGSLVARYRGGGAWRFPDAAAATAFLEAARDGRVPGARPPDVRWHELGGAADAEAGLDVAGLARGGLTVGAEAALGLRSDGARRTLTLDVELEELDLSADLPGVILGGSGRRSIVADVTWEGGAARELALRSAVADGDRLEELAARIDLREPASRAVAERLLRPGGPAAEDVRAFARRAARHGVVERTGWATSEDRTGLSLAARAGVALALSHERVTAVRRLTDAVAWVGGGPARRRFDCLGV